MLRIAVSEFNNSLWPLTPASYRPWEEAVMAHVVEFLPPTWMAWVACTG